jgi:hypothetical protein
MMSKDSINIADIAYDAAARSNSSAGADYFRAMRSVLDDAVAMVGTPLGLEPSVVIHCRAEDDAVECHAHMVTCHPEITFVIIPVER